MSPGLQHSSVSLAVLSFLIMVKYYITKLTILIIFKLQFFSGKYIYIVVQTLPPTFSKTFSSCQTKILSTSNNNSPLPPLPIP